MIEPSQTALIQVKPLLIVLTVGLAPFPAPVRVPRVRALFRPEQVDQPSAADRCAGTAR